MAEQSFIPLLGINKKILDRQAPAGLCDDIKNLRPEGLEDNPYWVPVEKANKLKNASEKVFSHSNQENIVAIGVKQGMQRPDGTQLKRFVLVFSDGTLDVVNPDGRDDWEVVTTYDFSGDDEGTWEADFATVAEVFVISIIKDDLPYKLLYLYKDTVIPYGFPFLPKLFIEQEKTEQYGQTEIENGLYDGLSNGYYAYRYGFRLGEGKNVAVSSPIPFHVGYDDGYFANLKFTLTGYDVDRYPENLSFWKNMFTGIDVFLSEKHDSKEDVLMNGIFYNICTFDKIVPEGEASKVLTYKGKTSEISLNEVLGAGNNTRHRIMAKPVYSYNSHLILGSVAVDFVKPPLNIYSYSEQTQNIRISAPYKTGPTIKDHYLKEYVNLDVILEGDGVLPKNAVNITNAKGTRSVREDIVDITPTLTQQSDTLVTITFLEAAGHIRGWTFYPDEAYSHISLDVTAQAYDAMSGGNKVGDEFSKHIEQDLDNIQTG